MDTTVPNSTAECANNKYMTTTVLTRFFCRGIILTSVLVFCVVFMTGSGGVAPVSPAEATSVGTVSSISAPIVAETGVQAQVDESHSAEDIDLDVRISGEILENGEIIDETAVDDGDEVTISGDLELQMNIQSPSTIDLVSVRLGGETRRSYTPDTRSFNESTELSLGPGRYDDVTIVVEANATRTMQMVLVSDQRAPLATFRSPFEAGFVGENGSYVSINDTYTLDESDVRIDLDFSDRVDVKRAVLNWRYEYNSNTTQPIVGRAEFRPDNPNNGISEQHRLGWYDAESDAGKNTLSLEVEDAFGKVRTHEITVLVNDSDTPDITVTNKSSLRGERAVRLNFTASDRVGLKSVGARQESSALKYLIFQRAPLERPTEQDFSQVVSVPRGTTNITLVAEDSAGNTKRVKEKLNYTEPAPPTIRFHPDEIKVRGKDGSTIRARGTVSNGQIVRVRVETVAPGGEILDVETVYEGEGDSTDRVDIDKQLRAGVDPVRLRARVVDITGAENVKSLQLSEDDFVSDSDQETPTPTSPATPIGSPTPTPTESADQDAARGQLFVASATVNDTKVSPKGTIQINATVKSSENSSGRGKVGLVMNGTLTSTGLSSGATLVETKSVTVPENESRTVSFTYTANETGTYRMAVNETVTEPVTVGNQGLLGKVFGFLDPVFGLFAFLDPVFGLFGGLPLGLLRPLALYVGGPIAGIYLVLKALAYVLGY